MREYDDGGNDGNDGDDGACMDEAKTRIHKFMRQAQW